MKLENLRIGVAITGSFCTYAKAFQEIRHLVEEGAIVQTIFSDMAQTVDSRFGKAADFLQKAQELTGHEPMKTIEAAEVIGPTGCLDILVILPCTGNTMAKLTNGITDTPVLMAAKAHLRNGKPVVISLSTNDALGMNLKNIGYLLNSKNIFFVPFGQDDPVKKPNSMTAYTELLIPTILKAMEGKQYQPVIGNKQVK
ncbi:dipicolinate synthase subunit B [Anaerostipes sp. 494a]|uniref:dipicolinate synthase subunit B n=1 Tax=Anaerostipes sp. 494a TaxID=1261636 RepID=UPI000950E67C|nr:dipicolinate synthase subunit B [Anaerostipes sp. 494a]MDY2725286.1 dipicolinate synthase subunit B [Anaerostipes faecalis]OLR58970.1 dipicolinate synthase subunit B [Anaerostipes sp. 494a]